MQNRDADEKVAPPSAGEIWRMRAAGLFAIVGGCYLLYALLTNMPGAEFIGC